MLLLLATLLFALFLFHQLYWRLRKLPPGPFPLPIIGNLHQIVFAKRWEDKFVQFKERYGPIYTLFMGPNPVITVNDYESCTKLFINEPDTYSDRPYVDHFNFMTRGAQLQNGQKYHRLTRNVLISAEKCCQKLALWSSGRDMDPGGEFGIVQTNGARWQEQRRAVLRILRDFGMGKNQAQERILDEVQTVCDILNKEIDAGIINHDVIKHTDIGVGSVINSLVCGFRLTLNDKSTDFDHLKYWTNQFIRHFSNPLTNIGINSERLAKFPLIRTKMNEFKEVFDQLFSFVDKVIAEHKKLNDYENYESEPVDLIDAYMVQMWKARKTGNGQYYSDDQCRNIVLELWLAGQETTSTTIAWALTYLILNPDKQAKVHEELDREINGDRLILIADRTRLPYTNAMIAEVQRCASLAVFNAPHAISKDVTLNGYELKRGTVIFPQVSTIMRDPKNFPDPDKFQPERFINSEGQLFNLEKVIPFGLGRRICLGESLARMELFLFMSNLLNQYKFTAGDPAPTTERFVNGGTSICKHFKCRLEKRF